MRMLNVPRDVAGPEYPTPRQIVWWREDGAFGPEMRRRGSGNHITWSEPDKARLRTIRRVINDLAGLGLQPSTVLVSKLWAAMSVGDDVLEHAGIRITWEKP